MASPSGPVTGRRLAGLEVNGRAWHTAVEQGGAFLFRFAEVCDVRISPDLSRVAVSPHLGGHDGMVPIVLSGNVIALLLTLMEREVMHGSAVEIDGQAVAFVGHSGSGKSTLAAEACLTGARMVADDLLAVELDAGRPRCLRGGPSVRLRAGVAHLAERLPGACSTTYDGRTAVATDPVRLERPPLAAIVLPRVAPGLPAPTVTRLGSGAAFHALTPYHRLAGLVDPAAVRRHFHACAELADGVPVFVMEMAVGDAARAAAAATAATVVERAGAS